MIPICPGKNEKKRPYSIQFHILFFQGKMGIILYWFEPHLGQIKGGGALRIDQPQAVQVATSSPSIPLIIGPHLAAPQGPVPAPVLRLTASKLFAPAWIAFTIMPLRILLQRQMGR